MVINRWRSNISCKVQLKLISARLTARKTSVVIKVQSFTARHRIQCIINDAASRRLIQMKSEMRVATDLSQPLHHWNPPHANPDKAGVWKWNTEGTAMRFHQNCFPLNVCRKYTKLCCKSPEKCNKGGVAFRVSTRILKEIICLGYICFGLCSFFCKPFEAPVSEQIAFYEKPSRKHAFFSDAVWGATATSEDAKATGQKTRRGSVKLGRRTASITRWPSTVLDLLFTRCCSPSKPVV